MIQHSYKDFYARMLGGFFIYFRSQELVVPMRIQSRAMQLLLRLIKAGSDGIDRKELVDTFQRGCYDWKKQINNFRQQVHNLRRVLSKADFPEGKYIVLKGARYYFTLDYEVETDTGRLDRLLPLIQSRTGAENSEEMRALLMEFCRIYTGEFLPVLNGEEWVNLESAYYQKWYVKCLERLCEILRQEGSYEEMLELCTTASQIHPYDGWQMLQSDCLMSLNRHQEAIKIYEDAAQMFYEDLGIRVTDQVMRRYQNVERRIYDKAGSLANMMGRLREPEESKDPYCCSCPSFLDIYRVISRLQEQEGVKKLLLVCTVEVQGIAGDETCFQEEKPLKDAEEVNNWERLEPYMEQLQSVLKGVLGRGDVYTRYSANQFLVLLIGVGQDSCRSIVRRIENRWREVQIGKAVLRFMEYSEESSVVEEGKNEKDSERNLYDPYY